ncbi:lactamase [Schizopora paradoxa]|uniref:Lactamase n=1 Tax=Schizopora paradoxa TaxID=27342 RepID=A0A0H2S8A3_9AGAM|nr:lactamase [Schizopora paradoxa]
MEKLQQLPNIAQLTGRVCRVLGQNPGKFTLQGTNTYLIGEQAPFILLDTGEGRQSYLPVLEDALRTNARLEPDNKQNVSSFSDVIITHHHHDHYGGLRDVLELSRKLWEERRPSNTSDTSYAPPRIHKFIAANHTPETTVVSKREENEEGFRDILSSLPDGTYSTPQNSPDLIVHELLVNQTLRTEDGSSTISIIHTPGHTPDSIALFLHEDRILFTADSVLGHGTAVFEDLAAYLASLHKLLEMRDKVGWAFQKVYPAHGPVVEDGPALIQKYIDHRLEREGQIMDLLHKTPTSFDSDSWSIEQLVSVIYKDYPESLWIPAAHSVELHLRKLQSEEKVKFINGEGMQSRWLLCSKL